MLVYANGGQSQFETWDLKPEAPAEIRGQFGAIASRVPGTAVCEHLPRLAGLADRFAIVRSVSHDDLDHGSAAYLALTGRYHPRKSSNPAPSRDDYPTLGAVMNRLRPTRTALCTAAHVNMPIVVPELPAPGQDGGFLGRADAPLVIADPAEPGASLPGLELPDDVPSVRLEARRSLLEAIERARRDGIGLPGTEDQRSLDRRAFELLSDPNVRRAFDLSAEPESVRDRYGRFRSGVSCLLARRLVEAGVPWITVAWNHSARGQDKRPGELDWLGWDTHNDIFDVMGELLPRFDLSLSALLEDLDARGLLGQTLVVCMGEFGRAPRVALERRFAGASPGRKHWANAYSIFVAGAGTTPGAVVGGTDRMGAYPTSDRVGPWDVAATMFASLGVDPHAPYRDPLDRPFHATTGRPIEALYG
ncbi:DUF1501 domain-containing protein [Tautonia sociabilis]|uniref:DUF1501 domain-containing protein n=1 Tax=Tautonia sociabilis TaxID=2080755 RepID=UPI0018F509B9|nr:DUF1501 domain-containing protein [Tautonia sociabilis]